MSVIPSIDLNIIDNQITNLQDIINSLNSAELNQELITHIKTLRNHLTSLDVSNKEDLEHILDSKIMEYQAQEERNSSNQESLRMLKELNKDYQNLGIISTKAEDNDSNKFIDYLIFTNEYGEVEMLSCDSDATINNFIKDHTNELPTLSAKEVFRYFKEYIHRELKFQNPNEFKNNEEMRKQALVNAPEIERQELEDIEEYKKKFGIADGTMVTVDINGERIYRIRDGIIKFKTVNTKREMQVLKQPTIKQENTYDSLLSELDEEPILEQAEITTVTENMSAKSDSYSSLEDINEIDNERIIELISKRDVYDIELSYGEEHELNTYIKHLLSSVAKAIETKTQCGKEYSLLIDIMEKNRGAKPSIVSVYQDIKSGNLKENELTDIDKEFASRYLDYKEQVITYGLNNNLNKQLKLLDQSNQNHGVATLIMLMELITLAMLILTFLRLDI